MSCCENQPPMDLKTIILKDTVSAAQKVDRILEIKYAIFCESLDSVYNILDKHKVISKGKDNQYHEAVCMSLLYKTLNYLICGYQNLRLTYRDITNGIIRCAIEASTSAVLFSKKRDFYELYLNDKFNPTKSLNKLIKNYKEFGFDKKRLGKLKGYKEHLNKYIHPTKVALAENQILGTGGIAVGSQYDPLKQEAYLKDMGILIEISEDVQGAYHQIVSHIK